jgi:hypothetical protein
MTAGLVQQSDKIVVRFAHTIYPYSLGIVKFFNYGFRQIFINFVMSRYRL